MVLECSEVVLDSPLAAAELCFDKIGSGSAQRQASRRSEMVTIIAISNRLLQVDSERVDSRSMGHSVSPQRYPLSTFMLEFQLSISSRESVPVSGHS